MKANRILFPTDFSHTGDAALEMATSLAKESNATLIIAHIEEPPIAYHGGWYYGVPEPSRDQVLSMLHKVKPTDEQVAHEYRLESGDPAEAVVRLAKEEGVDLIVLGTHGRTGVSRVLMGSVAEEIVRKAECPVLTYKKPEIQEASA